MSPSLKEVYLAGSGLCCALGNTVAECAASLSAGSVSTVDLVLDGFSEPVAMPYYRIPDGAELFDDARFERLILKAVHEAIKNSGLSEGELEGLPVFVGSSAFSISLSETRYAAELLQDPLTALPLPYVDYQLVADIAGKALKRPGPSYSFNTACTAAANALMSATRMLQLGWHKHALVLGLELANRTTLAGFSGLQLIAKSLRPFDLNRRGIVLGEGVGAVVLSGGAGKHPIKILAAASNCDTHSVTTANPDGSSIGSVEAEVLAAAGVEAAEIRAVKAHATASPMNDTGEAAGMHRIFKPLPPVLALKPYIGHTLGACGINELILLASALKEGYLPPVPGFETEDPLLNLKPLQERVKARPGYYLLNYFGFGGNNTALVIESLP